MDWKKDVRRSSKAIFLVLACILSAAPLVLRLRRPPDIVISLKEGPPIIRDASAMADEASVADADTGVHSTDSIPTYQPEDDSNSDDAANKSASQAETAETIFVHVAGSVEKPGLYELPAASRVSHAIDAAGGMSEDASSSAVNIALPLRDGQQVFIPAEMDLATPKATPPAMGEPSLQEDRQENTAEPALGDRVEGRLDVTSTEPAETESGLPKTLAQKMVDINSAGQAELEGLPGIGPSLAQKIIEYREMNGPFGNAEELMEVSGIGTSKYAALKDRIVTR